MRGLSILKDTEVDGVFPLAMIPATQDFPSVIDAAICRRYECHVHRTTILLPNELRQRADREAKALGISLSELIRRRLAADGDASKSDRPRFYTRQPWTGQGPIDTASNHDAYLYGP